MHKKKAHTADIHALPAYFEWSSDVTGGTPVPIGKRAICVAGEVFFWSRTVGRGHCQTGQFFAFSIARESKKVVANDVNAAACKK
eukprot:scaffold51886_cov48-Attheya_sp.AAC.1